MTGNSSHMRMVWERTRQLKVVLFFWWVGGYSMWPLRRLELMVSKLCIGGNQQFQGCKRDPFVGSRWYNETDAMQQGN